MAKRESFRIGIVCGKLGDVDGVSLEVDKWIAVLKALGHEVITIAGKYATQLESVPAENQLTLERLSFDDDLQLELQQQVFPHLSKYHPHLSDKHVREILDNLRAAGKEVSDELIDDIKEKDIDVIIAENTNAMPMTLVGGVAVYNVSTRHRIATIFHHHDFWWERSRFSHSPIEQFLGEIMPPTDPALEHVVISSYAAHILQTLKRVHPTVVPNCEDFTQAVQVDDYNASFRKDFGFADDDVLVVQPTRIVRRKRIEDAVLLLGKLAQKYEQWRGKLHLIISLYQGDEPDETYISQIWSLADYYGIPVHLISDRVSSERGVTSEGQKMYTNRDVLANADIVTYLPFWEGFGNALLEAVAAKVPLVVTSYLVYKTDIKMCGFKNIEILAKYDEDDFLIIPDQTLRSIHAILTNAEKRRRMVEHNFRVGEREFGFKKLKCVLSEIIDAYTPEIQASRRRIKKSKVVYSV